MTIQDQFSSPTRIAQDSITRAAQSWTQGVARGFERFRVPAPVVPVDPTVLVTQWFDAAHQVLEVNRTYLKDLANVVTGFEGVIREQAASSVEAARDQLTQAVELAEHEVEAFDQTAREQVTVVQDVQEDIRREAEEAERAAEREAKAAERAAQREAKNAAREKYESLRKSDLVDELGRRDLPKTGNVDELVERLVADDTK